MGMCHLLCYPVLHTKGVSKKREEKPTPLLSGWSMFIIFPWKNAQKTKTEAEVMTSSKSGNSPLPGSFPSFITRDVHDLAGLEVGEAHVWCTGVREYPEGWRKKERPCCWARPKKDGNQLVCPFDIEEKNKEWNFASVLVESKWPEW